MIHTREEPSVVRVTWRRFTLVEARGFIEYVVQLHLVPSVKRQEGSLVQRVPMNRNQAVFRGLDPLIDYEASVGTVSLLDNTTGPGQC
jgi:hypothetical protein